MSAQPVMSERARSILRPDPTKLLEIEIANLESESTRAKLVARDRINKYKALDLKIAEKRAKLEAMQ